MARKYRPPPTARTIRPVPTARDAIAPAVPASDTITHTADSSDSTCPAMMTPATTDSMQLSAALAHLKSLTPERALIELRNLWQQASNEGIGSEVEDLAAYTGVARSLEDAWLANLKFDTRRHITLLQESLWREHLGGLRLYMLFGDAGCKSRSFLQHLRDLCCMEKGRGNGSDGETLSLAEALRLLRDAAQQRREGRFPGCTTKKTAEWVPLDAQRAAERAQGDGWVYTTEYRPRTAAERKAGDRRSARKSTTPSSRTADHRDDDEDDDDANDGDDDDRGSALVDPGDETERSIEIPRGSRTGRTERRSSFPTAEQHATSHNSDTRQRHSSPPIDDTVIGFDETISIGDDIGGLTSFHLDGHELESDHDTSAPHQPAPDQPAPDQPARDEPSNSIPDAATTTMPTLSQPQTKRPRLSDASDYSDTVDDKTCPLRQLSHDLLALPAAVSHARLLFDALSLPVQTSTDSSLVLAQFCPREHTAMSPRMTVLIPIVEQHGEGEDNHDTVRRHHWHTAHITFPGSDGEQEAHTPACHVVVSSLNSTPIQTLRERVLSGLRGILPKAEFNDFTAFLPAHFAEIPLPDLLDAADGDDSDASGLLRCIASAIHHVTASPVPRAIFQFVLLGAIASVSHPDRMSEFVRLPTPPASPPTGGQTNAQAAFDAGLKAMRDHIEACQAHIVMLKRYSSHVRSMMPQNSRKTKANDKQVDADAQRQRQRLAAVIANGGVLDEEDQAIFNRIMADQQSKKEQDKNKPAVDGLKHWAQLCYGQAGLKQEDFEVRCSSLVAYAAEKLKTEMTFLTRVGGGEM